MNTQRQKVDRRAAKAWLLLPPASRALLCQPPLRRDTEDNYREYVLLANTLGVVAPPRPAKPEKPPAPRPQLGLTGWASVRRLKARGLLETDAIARVQARQRKAANAH